jgi:hypothetical protein
MICFILKLFKVELGSVDLVVLGFAFLAAHLTFGSIVTIPTYRKQVL